MAYHEEESTRLRRQTSRQAIALAMEGRWREAVTANQHLIESFPNDVDAYNRLGRAHMELGEYALAKEAYQKAIKVDPYNTIAQKNLNRLSHLKEKEGEVDGQEKVEPQQFIEEVAKAGVVNLRRLASAEILAKAVAGSKVNLKVDGPRLLVENSHGEYLGQVEPRHAQRLIKLMAGGNKYVASIVSSAENAVAVIIRETYQHPSQSGKTSFPSRGSESVRAEMDDRIGDRIIRRTLEHLDEEQTAPGDTGYAIVGGDDTDVEELSEQLEDEDDESEDEE
ncbi:MAG TPA: tetratricopeptide repeat protein, partial [Dehalococcoidales bacterium]|nr:tetratricopeptide repeat protein [Dehalococcoidales bacterium]